MSILAQDSFSRANQAGWGLASDGINTWSVVIGGAANFSIASNEGQISGNTSLQAAYLGSGTSADMDVLVRFSPSASTDLVYVFLRGTASNTQYRIKQTATVLSINRVIAGAATTLQTHASTVTAGSFYWMRARCQGATICAKVWADGGTEPGAWTVMTQDASPITGAGQWGLAAQLGVTTDTVKFDSFLTTGIKTMSTGVRVPVRTQITQSTGLRALIATQRSLSTGVRTLVRVQHNVTSVLRTLVRTQSSKSSAVRVPVRTQSSKTSVLRTVVRGISKAAPLRVVVRGISKTSVLRVVVRGITRATGLRVPVKTQSSKTSVLRTRVRTQVSKAGVLRAPIRTQRSRCAQVRIIVIAPPPLTRPYVTVVTFRDGVSIVTLRDGVAVAGGR